MKTLKIVVSVAALLGIYWALRRWASPLPSRTRMVEELTATFGGKTKQTVRLLEVGSWNESTNAWDTSPQIVIETTHPDTGEVRRHGPYETQVAARRALEEMTS